MADFNIANEKGLANFVIDIIGRDGGIKFNTEMVSHNGHLYNEIPKTDMKELKNGETIYIGIKGQPITKEHIKTFLMTLDQYLQLKVFQNGRSYCFQGIYSRSSKNRKYYISWGT